MITHDQLVSILRYDPETGNFYWINPRVTQRRWIGKVAGSTRCTVGRSGRSIKIMLLRKSYTAHRLAWFYVHREWPKAMIDHINGNPFDNRIVNLREATASQNQFNRKVQKTNRLGIKGVHHSNTPGKFVARIRINGRMIHLGTFVNIDLARAAYAEAAFATRGEFARV